MKQYTGFINTPPLWLGTQYNLTQFILPSINLSNFTPEPIPTNLRLGHQVEYIFKQLLNHSERYEVIAHNIQIKRDKITLGELDFIVEDRFRESVKIHIELTYKFYIIVPTKDEPIKQLVGPNQKDHFYLKIIKTREQQLPLAHTKEGRDALAAYNIDITKLEQRTLFMGQIFTPYSQPINLPREINKRAIAGYWIAYIDFCTATFKPHKYYVTTKPEWLHQPHKAVKWLDHTDVVAIIKNKHLSKRAPLLWVYKENGSFEKVFVVWW